MVAHIAVYHLLVRLLSQANIIQLAFAVSPLIMYHHEQHHQRLLASQLEQYVEMITYTFLPQ